MKPDPVKNFLITRHAAFEIKRRGLSQDIVGRVMGNPEQRINIRHGRAILQSRIEMEELKKIFLVRVFVDVDRSPPEVVTAYRTSKISKYWR